MARWSRCPRGTTTSGASPTACWMSRWPSPKSGSRSPSEVMKFKRMVDVDLRGKRVFIRADLNVPIENGRITDDTRIRASVPGIKLALERGAAVMVTSHLGRPTEGQLKSEDSLAPVAARLAELPGRDAPLRQNWVNGVDVETG